MLREGPVSKGGLAKTLEATNRCNQVRRKNDPAEMRNSKLIQFGSLHMIYMLNHTSPFTEQISMRHGIFMLDTETVHVHLDGEGQATISGSSVIMESKGTGAPRL